MCGAPGSPWRRASRRARARGVNSRGLPESRAVAFLYRPLSGAIVVAARRRNAHRCRPKRALLSAKRKSTRAASALLRGRNSRKMMRETMLLSMDDGRARAASSAFATSARRLCASAHRSLSNDPAAFLVHRADASVTTASSSDVVERRRWQRRASRELITVIFSWRTSQISRA